MDERSLTRRRSQPLVDVETHFTRLKQTRSKSRSLPLAVVDLIPVRSPESRYLRRVSNVFARWQRALRSSIKLCLKSYSYPTGDPLRLPYQRVSSPHPYEQGFLIQMNAVETRGVRRAVYSFLAVWSSVVREMRKNRRLRRSYISPKEFVSRARPLS